MNYSHSIKFIAICILSLFCFQCIFAQEISLEKTSPDPNLILYNWQVSAYKILGGCIDWDNDIEFRRNRVAEHHNIPGSEAHGRFKRWKENTPTIKSGCDSGNCMNGTGKYIDSNANVYIGEFRNGKKNGFGKMIYHTRYTDYFYEGYWKNDNREGFGKLGEAKNKEVPVFYFYTGNWKDDHWNGEGILINDHNHGDDVYLYKGNFLNGFAFGKGSLIFLKTTGSDNERLENELNSFWKKQSKRSTMKPEDIPEGIIIKRYEGNFINIKPDLPVINMNYAQLDGYGLFVDNNGNGRTRYTYQGFFCRGKIVFGTELYENLTSGEWARKEGKWRIAERYHGFHFGRQVWNNGQQYIGYYRDAQYNGAGKFTYSNKLNGKSDNDLPDTETGIFKDGKYIRPLTREELIDFTKRTKDLESELGEFLEKRNNTGEMHNIKYTGDCLLVN